jgi:hypothetical protein
VFHRDEEVVGNAGLEVEPVDVLRRNQHGHHVLPSVTALHAREPETASQ